MRAAFYAGYAPIRAVAALDLFVATQFNTMLLWASAFLKHDSARVAEYEP